MSGQNISNSKNVNTVTNNYNIYPGNPTGQTFLNSGLINQPSDPEAQSVPIVTK